jgi:hypothetical protein
MSRSPGSATCDDRDTRRQDRPRALLGPAVRVREHLRGGALPARDDGRLDLPVVAPGESPRRVARRLV